MHDPVTTADGQVYEREAIETWLQDHNTSPLTGKVLTHTELTPSPALRSKIERWAEGSITAEEALRGEAYEGPGTLTNPLVRDSAALDAMPAAETRTQPQLAAVAGRRPTVETDAEIARQLQAEFDEEAKSAKAAQEARIADLSASKSPKADPDERVSNLKARFPQHSEEAIRKALEDSGGHAGLASIALTQLIPP